MAALKAKLGAKRKKGGDGKKFVSDLVVMLHI
jgi:hypothetical protein